MQKCHLLRAGPLGCARDCAGRSDCANREIGPPTLELRRGKRSQGGALHEKSGEERAEASLPVGRQAPPLQGQRNGETRLRQGFGAARPALADDARTGHPQKLNHGAPETRESRSLTNVRQRRATGFGMTAKERPGGAARQGPPLPAAADKDGAPGKTKADSSLRSE